MNGKKSYELGVGIHALTPEQRVENGRVWNYGISFSSQSKEKMRKTKKHRYSLGLYTKFNTNHSQETKDKIAESKRGKKLSQEHKNKISKCSSGRTWIHNKKIKERKFIKKEEVSSYLLNSWENGKGVIWMNNGVECMCADIWDYQSFISCGYTDGRI